MSNMKRQIMLTAFVCVITLISANAQLREIPKEVEKAFTAQYPGIDSAEYKDNLVNVKVHFTQNGEKMIASYTNKGLWKETEKQWSYEQLDQAIKDGFEKSKYADWKVVETIVLYRPNNVELYRVKVEKSELQKKNLYFNTKGRLVEDGITL
jgi:hypothetical protein